MAFLFVALLLAGCSASPGKGLTLFPQNHRLSDEAKELRTKAPMPAPLPRELNKGVLAAYIVEPGDALVIQAANLDSPVRLPSDQPILPDGTINLGRYGRLLVAGKTVDEIQVAVRAAVEAQTKDAGPIVVRLVTRQSKVYYVLGDVNSPGAFPYSGRETVLDGIIAAGGLTDKSSRENIILSRPTPPDSCRIVLPICLPQIVQLGDTSTNYQLLPGDRIFVPSRDFWEGFPLCPKKKKCTLCSGPQTACPLDANFCGHPSADPMEGLPPMPPSLSPASPGVVRDELLPISK